MIYVTEKAANKILEIAAEEDLGGKPLRVKVVGGGCAGFSYDLFFSDDDPLPMDEVFENNGVTVIIDPLSFQYMDGAEIDYIDKDFVSGFKFNNPNVSASCGCGSSVAF